VSAGRQPGWSRPFRLKLSAADSSVAAFSLLLACVDCMYLYVITAYSNVSKLYLYFVDEVRSKSNLVKHVQTRPICRHLLLVESRGIRSRGVLCALVLVNDVNARSQVKVYVCLLGLVYYGKWFGMNDGLQFAV